MTISPEARRLPALDPSSITAEKQWQTEEQV